MATNQGVVAEEERLHDLFVGDCGDGPAHESSEQSDIKESSTPPDLIVQRQLRDVIMLQNATIECLHQNVMKSLIYTTGLAYYLCGAYNKTLI